MRNQERRQRKQKCVVGNYGNYTFKSQDNGQKVGIHCGEKSDAITDPQVTRPAPEKKKP